MSAAIEQRNQEATCYIGNLDEKVNEELLWELMLQAGPIVNVHIPKDKVSNKYLGYGFVEFRTEEDAEYAIKIMNMIKIFGKPIKINKASQNKVQLDIGANIFIGNLDLAVDEKLLYDTFSSFGGILQAPKIMRDPETNASKGFGFVSFDSFEASDLAIECMNGQYLCNRAIMVQYAFKKDSPGERHGSQPERLLAASNASASAAMKPHTVFAGGAGLANTIQAMTASIPGVMPGQGGMIMQPPSNMIPGLMMMQQPPPPPTPQDYMMQQHQQQQQQQQQMMMDPNIMYQMYGQPPPMPMQSMGGYPPMYGMIAPSLTSQPQYGYIPPPPPPPPM